MRLQKFNQNLFLSKFEAKLKFQLFFPSFESTLLENVAKFGSHLIQAWLHFQAILIKIQGKIALFLRENAAFFCSDFIESQIFKFCGRRPSSKMTEISTFKYPSLWFCSKITENLAISRPDPAFESALFRGSNKGSIPPSLRGVANVHFSFFIPSCESLRSTCDVVAHRMYQCTTQTCDIASFSSSFK